MNSTLMKSLMFWMIPALVIFVFWNVSARVQKNERQLSFSEFVVQLERGHVNDVTIAGNSISGTFKNGQSFRTYTPPQAEGLVERLLDKGVVVKARDVNSSSWLGHIISWTPIAIMVAFLIFFMRQIQGSSEASLMERRLQTKARLYELLSESSDDLSREDLSAQLSGGHKKELSTVLYQMLREGTIVLTTARKYRVKTVD